MLSQMNGPKEKILQAALNFYFCNIYYFTNIFYINLSFCGEHFESCITDMVTWINKDSVTIYKYKL